MHYKQMLAVCCTAVLSLFLTNVTLAQEGNVCETPNVISSLPYDDAGNTSTYGNDYSSVDLPTTAPGAVVEGTGSNSYLNGDDVVYAYTPSADGVINVSTTNDDDWIGLWAFTGCPFSSTVGYHTQTNGTTRAINGLSVLANTTYYFLISTWPTPNSTDYTIHVEEAVPDCPELGLNIGSPCDDGDPNTVSDTVNENCECEGIPMAANDEPCTATALMCGDTVLQSFAGATMSIDDDCFGSSVADVWFSFDSDGSQVFTVAEGGDVYFDAIVQLYKGTDCNELIEMSDCQDSPESFTVSETGTYFFRIRPYSTSGESGIATVHLTCTPFDCPALLANIGDACDDGDPNTLGDKINENCECEGTLPQACENSTKYPSAAVAAGPDLTTLSTCNYLSEYSEITNITSGDDYEFTVTGNGYITVRTGSVGGSVVATGFSPLTVTAPNSDNLFAHWSADADCSTSSGCQTTTVQCTSCQPFDCMDIEANIGDACDDGDPNTHSDMINANCECEGSPAGECVNAAKYPGSAITASADLATISTCNYLQEYSEIDGVISGETYQFTVTGNGWITVRTGSVGGSVVSTGTSPVSVTAPNSDNLFVHWNADDECGTASGCQITTVQCTSCAIIYDCPELEANIGDACDDGDPNTINDEINGDCECEGTSMVTNDEACSATELLCGDTVMQSFAGATMSIDDDCYGSSEADVWFSFDSDGSQVFTVAEGGDIYFDAIVQLYKGTDCNGLTEMSDCQDSPESFTVTEAGTYFFRIRPYSVTGESGIATVHLTCTPFDCPALLANFGDACDDGDPNTLGDVINENCECEGTLPQECENSTKYPSAAVTASADLYTISSCQYLQEYSEITGIMNGETYEFTVSGDGYMTVRTGSAGGSVVGMGVSSLSVTAPNSDNLFVHWSAGADCSTATGCQTSTVQCTTCSVIYDCPDLEANIGDTCDDGDPNTINDTVTEDCECAGDLIPSNDDCDDAISIACGETLMGSTAAATASGLSATCGSFTSSTAKDLFYTFEADGTSDYVISVDNAGTGFIDIVLFAYSGECGNLEEITCADDGSPETIELLAPDAGTYTIRFFAYSGTGQFSVNLECNENVAWDCPDIEANIGDACDDGDPNTENDVITEDCECAGTFVCTEPQPAVTGLSTEYVEGEGMLFHWDAVPNSIGCQLRLSSADNVVIKTAKLWEFEAESFMAPRHMFDYATDYLFAIRCGCSQSPVIAGPWSTLAFSTPSGPSMISTPNPTSGVSNVTFEVVTEEHTTLEVYDMNGRSLEVLYNGMAIPNGEYRFQFNGTALPAGVYIYRLTTESDVVIEKFMIAK